MSGYDDEQDFEAGGDWGNPADDSEETPDEEQPRSIEDNPYVDRLLRDPRLREAMHNGEYGRFQGLLEYYRSRADEAEQVAAVDYVRAHPQLFAPPVDKPPAMFTLSGFGTRLSGKTDYDPSTGFYIATLYLTLLFIPVLPLRRYLVRSGDGNNYEFYGKYGVTAAQNVWRVMLVLGLMGMGALVALAIAISSITYEPDVQIINAFDEPVEVTVDGEETYEIAPRTLETKSIPEGTRQFTTRFVDGPEIEELDFEVPRRTDVVVYNIAGAAPAIVESVTYFDMEGAEYRTGAYLDHEEEYDLLAGIRRYVRDDVHYIDVEPPEEIDTVIGGRTVRWALYYEVLTQDGAYEDYTSDFDVESELADALDPELADSLDWDLDDGGESDVYVSDEVLEYYLTPEAALDQLAYEHIARMEELLERLVRLRPRQTWHHFWLREQFREAIDHAEWSDSPADWQRAERWFDIVDAIGKEHPEAVELHLLLIELKEMYGDELGRTPAAERYRQHHEEFDTAATAYLLTYVIDDAGEMESLLQRIIDDDASPELLSSAHRSFGFIHYEVGDCSSAIEHFETSRGIDAGLIFEDFVPYVECLVKEQRFNEARDFLRRAHDESARSEEFLTHEPTIIYARVVLSEEGSQGDPFLLIRSYYRDAEYMEFDGDAYVHNANAMGVAIDEDEARRLRVTEFGRDARQINEVLYQRPEDLVEASRYMSDNLIASGRDVGFLVSLLMAAEGDETGFDTLWAYHFDQSHHIDEVRREVRMASNGYRFDGPPPEQWRPAERAAYYLARAYVTDDADERERALEKVGEETLLWGPLDGIAKAMKGG